MDRRTGWIAPATFLFAAVLWVQPSTASSETVELATYAGTVPGFSRALQIGRSGNVDEAARLLDSLRQKDPDDSDRLVPGGVVDFVLAGMYERVGRLEPALERYRAAAASPLGDLASWKIGRLLEKAGKTAGARTAFGSVSTASSMWIPSRLALAESLVREGRPSAAVTVLRAVLQTGLSGRPLHDVLMAFARATLSSGDPENATEVARRAYFDCPDGVCMRQASSFLASLGRWPDPALEYLRRLDRANLRELKKLDLAARKRPTALARHDAALPLVTRATFLIESGREDAALQLLARAEGKATHRDVRACILVLKANALLESGDDSGAADAWSEVVRLYPASPFAIRAGHAAFRAFVRSGEHASAISILGLLEELAPDAGSSLELLWERALAAMIEGRKPEALEDLEAILSAVDHGEGVLFGDGERARYFRGVLLFELGRKDEARRDLERVARSSAFSWFGVLAASRLDYWFGCQPSPTAVQDPGTALFDGALARSRNPVELNAIKGLRVSERGVAPVLLLRMGDRAAALEELSIRAARGYLSEDDLMIPALIRASSPDSLKATGAAAWIRGEFDSALAAVFEAAYPRPWSKAVASGSEAFDVDPALIYGLMRVESHYQPRARSPAGAFGLMQLMKGTASSISSKVLKPKGINASRSTPSGNVMIGSALLDSLIGHFEGYLPLVLASYHAGSGSGRRFLRTLGYLPTDLFVEALPFGRTRDYVKRVTGYVAGYRYLYGNGLPLRIALSAPDRTGPWIDVRSAQRPTPRADAPVLESACPVSTVAAGLRLRREPEPPR